VELKAVTASVYFSSDPGNPDTYAHFYADLQMLATTPGSPDPQADLQRFVTSQIANGPTSESLVRLQHRPLVEPHV
jgi:peptide/nickel transport system substrate-binding protein